MKEKTQKGEQHGFVFPKESLLFSVYSLKGKSVLVTSKDGICYLGVLVNVDKNFNLHLREVRFYIKTKKRLLHFLNILKEIILSGNKISIIAPVFSKTILQNVFPKKNKLMYT